MSRSPRRLATGGRIDRARRLNFSLEGRALQGFAGDTLASALLANGVTLVGRSFKYHRPRGFVSSGVEEPNGLFTLGAAGRTTPNVAGTVTDLYEGLSAVRQNGWPSVDWDLMAVTSWAAPLLAAGFYYKTFMGPRRKSWMFYEKFIRRAAGLGRGVHLPDPDRYETQHLFADVLVVGSGPAGLAAAWAAARAGAQVMLVEQDSELGGSLLSARLDSPEERWRAETVASLRRMPNLDIRCRTTALGLYDGNTVALVERHENGRPDPARGEAREIIITLEAGAIVFAAGTLERPLVFGGNDIPGVMLASAARSYLNRHAVFLGQRVVVATNNDAAWQSALDLATAGAAVTILDQRPTVNSRCLELANGAAITVQLDATPTRAIGARAVTGVRFSTSRASREHQLDCDLLCMSGGWSPVVHLTSHTGIKPRYRADIDSYVPGGYAAGHFGAGAMAGTFVLSAGIREGESAGWHAAEHAGYVSEAVRAQCSLPVGEDAACEVGPTRLGPTAARGKAFIDFQNDVTTRDIAIAYQEGFVSIEHLKRYTTLGMGTDQGKTSNVNGIHAMAAYRGLDPQTTGTTTFRPPYTPVSIGALAGRQVGQQFRPIRRSPLHEWHVANGAVLIEAGLWKRAWYYGWAGDSASAAYINEMKLVRSTVGICDVSSLGKIDVQGPDAAEFLDRVYVNNFARLPVGKARYGVMLNDDATVLDDGTTARFADTSYFMTTTTAQAAEVASRLEFLLQTAWVDLNVSVTLVTDEWAGMSIAGPKAREALQLALPGHDWSNERLPYMGCVDLDVDGVALRILRVSFSGELAFELYIAADRGCALWEHILARAASLGIRPYGLEALAALRIEKGHVAGLELDHRTTIDDLGLGKMAASNKTFVGCALRERPELRAPGRWSLVGLECLESGGILRGGAILFAPGDAVAGHGRGYITSVTWSLELGKYIALGLYQGGLLHQGEDVVCAYPLKHEQVRARIVAPVFVDSRGERLRV